MSMSDSEKVEADSTSTQEVKGEAKKAEEAPASANGDSSNGLSAQLEEKIIRQVEFYFGDRNLPRDKFLQSACSENEGGWVPITTLLTFNRLKALSSDSAYIIAALQKSTGNVLEVNSEGSAVRRSPDNPPPDIFSPEQRKKMKEKTVYVKGFDETDKLDDIQSFMDKYGKLEFVQMRRTLTEKTFKGSIFAEFKEKEMAEAFLGQSSIQFKGKELIKESKESYYQRKAEERKREKESKKASGAEEAAAPSKVETKGAVMHFKGSKGNTTREDIKAVMQEFATVAYIDFNKGDSEGHIRFEEEGGATKGVEGLKAAADGGAIQLCGADVEVKVLEGEAEVQYWTKALEERSRAKTRGRKGRGGHHGNQGDRKRRQRSRHGDGPATKQPKQEAKKAEGTKEEGDGKAEAKDGGEGTVAATEGAEGRKETKEGGEKMEESTEAPKEQSKDT